MPGVSDDPSPLERYRRAASNSAAGVIRDYSTSFGMAASLLGRGVRADVRNIYGLVRIADEIVDGAAAEAGLDPDAQRAVLDALEAEAEATTARGYSSNLVVHAFAETARSAGIGTELTAPFFWSMRRDLDPTPLAPGELARYIDGSAEVVGLMCLRVFLRDEPVTEARRAELEAGARRLGAAFQKVNFLRDLAGDWEALGRSYFPGVELEQLDDATVAGLLDDIDADLAAAAAVIPMLPDSCRVAVAAAHGLFAALAARLRATPAERIRVSRIRVSDPAKLVVAARAILGRGRVVCGQTGGSGRMRDAARDATRGAGDPGPAKRG